MYDSNYTVPKVTSSYRNENCLVVEQAPNLQRAAYSMTHSRGPKHNHEPQKKFIANQYLKRHYLSSVLVSAVNLPPHQLGWGSYKVEMVDPKQFIASNLYLVFVWSLSIHRLLYSFLVRDAIISK